MQDVPGRAAARHGYGIWPPRPGPGRA